MQASTPVKRSASTSDTPPRLQTNYQRQPQRRMLDVSCRILLFLLALGKGWQRPRRRHLHHRRLPQIDADLHSSLEESAEGTPETTFHPQKASCEGGVQALLLRH